MDRRRTALTLGLTLALGALASLAGAQAQYRFEELPANQPITAVGNDGVAVGPFMDPGTRANLGAIYQRGGMRTFQVPGSQNCFPSDLNNTNTVVGYATGTDGTLVGFTRKWGGAVATYRYPGSVSTAFFGINRVGTTLGAWFDGSTAHFFLRRPGDRVEDLRFPGYEDVMWSDINDAGTLVGIRRDAEQNAQALLWQNGAAVPISVPHALAVQVGKLNDRDALCGWWTDVLIDPLSGQNLSHGFVRDADGAITNVDFNGPWEPTANLDLGTEVAEFHYVGCFSTELHAMNDRGQLVGVATALYTGHWSFGPIDFLVQKQFLATPVGR